MGKKDNSGKYVAHKKKGYGRARPMSRREAMRAVEARESSNEQFQPPIPDFAFSTRPTPCTKKFHEQSSEQGKPGVGGVVLWWVCFWFALCLAGIVGAIWYFR